MNSSDHEPSAGHDVLRLVLASLLLLVAVSARSFGAKDDSCAYIDYARALAVGRFSEIHHQDYPPLYPLLIVIAHAAVGDWMWAAQAVTLTATALALLPLYLLARLTSGRRVAWICCWLALAHPLLVEWGVAAMSDGPYLFCYLSALLCAIQAARRGALLDYLLCGTLGAAAFLIRPEGLQLGLLLPPLALVGRGVRALPGLAAAGLAACVIAGPYIAVLSHAAGHLVLSKKKGVFQVAWLRWDEHAIGIPLRAPLAESDLPPPSTAADHLVNTRRRWIDGEALALEYLRLARSHQPVLVPPPYDWRAPDPSLGWSRPAMHLAPGQRTYFDHITDPPVGKEATRTGSVGLAVREFAEKFHPLATLALGCALGGAAIMLVRQRRRPSAMHLAIGAAIVLHFTLVAAHVVRYGYLSERHLIPLVALGLIWVAGWLAWLDDAWAQRGLWPHGLLARRGTAVLPSQPQQPQQLTSASSVVPEPRSSPRAVEQHGSLAHWITGYGAGIGMATRVLLVVFLADSLRPNGLDKLYLAQLSRTLQASDPFGLAPGAIVGREPRLAYFAGARHERLDPWRGYREVVRQIVAAQATVIMVHSEDRYRMQPLLELGWIEPLVTVEADIPRGKPLHLYRWKRTAAIAY
jgi:hypothetical protein